MKPRLTLLSRAYCHLCSDMLEQLHILQARLDFDLDIVDVDDDVALLARYDELVPVLLSGEFELCHYHLDPQLVADFVQNAGFGGAAKPLESRP
ncbi:MAG: glutaredoxin family protein [Gammaproteobacteria bacterium]